MKAFTFDGLDLVETEDGEPALKVSRECHLCGGEDTVEMQHKERKYDNDQYRFGCTKCDRYGDWDVIVLQAHMSWRELTNEVD